MPQDLKDRLRARLAAPKGSAGDRLRARLSGAPAASRAVLEAPPADSGTDYSAPMAMGAPMTATSRDLGPENDELQAKFAPIQGALPTPPDVDITDPKVRRWAVRHAMESGRMALSGVGRVGASVPAIFAKVIELGVREEELSRTGEAIGGSRTSDDAAETAAYFDDLSKKWTEALPQPDPKLAGSKAGFFSQGVAPAVGQGASMLGLAAVIGPLAGTPAALGTTALLAGAQEGVNAAWEAEAMGATDDQQLAAFWASLPLGVVEIATQARWLRALQGSNKVSGGRVVRFIKDLLFGATMEGGEEGVQTGLSNVIAADIVGYDRDRPLNKDVWENIKVGFWAGGILETAANIAGEVLGQAAAQDQPGATPPVVTPGVTTVTPDVTESLAPEGAVAPMESFAPEGVYPAADAVAPEAVVDAAPQDPGQTYYRGTKAGDVRRIKTGDAEWDSYLFVTDTEDGARLYGDSVEEVTLKPDAKVLREGTAEFVRVAGRWRKGESLLGFASRAARAAKGAGYDAIHFKRQTDVGTAILNESAVVQQAQSTDDLTSPKYSGRKGWASLRQLANDEGLANPGKLTRDEIVAGLREKRAQAAPEAAVASPVVEQPGGALEAMAPREWESAGGTRRVIGTLDVGGETRLVVQTGDATVGHALLSPADLEQEIRLDTSRLQSRARAAEAEEGRRISSQEAESTDGFADQFEPKKRGRVIKALQRTQGVNGKIDTRRNHVRRLVEEGYRVTERGGERVLQSPSGSWLTAGDLTKTGLDYAEYIQGLPAPKAAPEAAVTPPAPEQPSQPVEPPDAVQPPTEPPGAIPAEVVEGGNEGIAGPDTFLDRKIQQLHDYFRPFEVLEQEIERAEGVPLPDAERPHLWEDMRKGRTKRRTEALKGRYVDPMLRVMRDSGIVLGEMNEWLVARHAQERNEFIEAERDKTNPAGSGMTSGEAQEILDRIAEDPRAKEFERVGRKFDRMNRAVIEGLVADGDLSRAEADELLARWKHYAPLRHLDDTSMDDPRRGSGNRLNVRGKEFQKALGRHSASENALEFAITQARRAIIRGEKTKVGGALLALIRGHDTGIGVISVPEVKRVAGPDATVRMAYDPSYALKPNVISTKENGKEVHITFFPEHVRFAEAWKAMSQQDGRKLLEMSRTVTRTIAGLSTRHNPFFAPFNMMRDAQHAFLIGLADGGLPTAIKNTAMLPMAWETMMVEAGRGKTLDTRGDAWRDAYRQYVAEGAPMSFLDLDNVRALQKRISKDLDAARAGKKGSLQRWARGLVGAIDSYNDLFENGARLAAFKAKLDAGWSPKRAAQYAKNATVNFERKGLLTQNLNALYMFGQAGINGSARIMVPILDQKRVGGARSQRMLKVVGAVYAMGVLAEMMNWMLSGEDDNGEEHYAKQTRWVKDSNLMLPMGGGEYFTTPLPWGFSFFWNLGRNTTAFSMGKQSAWDSGMNVAVSFLDNFNPLGGAENVVSTVIPTVGDPIAETVMNQSWSGGPIKPTRFPNDVRPESELAWPETNRLWQKISRDINALTGGNEQEEGKLSISPEVLDYIVKGYTGSLGAEIARMAGMGEKVRQGNAGDIELREVPVLRRLYRKGNPFHEARRFHEISDEANISYNRYKGLLLAGEEKAADAYYEEKGWVIDLRQVLGKVREAAQNAEDEHDRRAIYGLLIREYNDRKPQ